MIRRLALFSLLVWLVAPSGAREQPFTAATLVGGTAQGFGSELWRFHSSGTTYRLEGRGRLTSPSGRSVVLPLSENCFISGRVYSGSFAGDLVLWLEESDAESAGGLLLRLDAATLKVRWKATFPAFNIGQSIAEGQAVYVTGYATVGKFDLRSGRCLWIVEEIGKSLGEEFAAFGLPSLSEKTVTVRSAARPGDKAGERGTVQNPGFVELDRRKGSVLRLQPTTYQVSSIGL